MHDSIGMTSPHFRKEQTSCTISSKKVPENHLFFPNIHIFPHSTIRTHGRFFMRYALLLMGLVTTLFFSGCSSGYHVQYLTPQPESKSHISAAVLPLTNLTTHPYAGKIVGDLLS